ncbi:MAG: hypothetical protein JXP34_20235 [Planctomycetes bacterium]|nr:hypothetical protein [Planctomycetota bacterium]
MKPEETEDGALEAARRLIADHGADCLWYLRKDPIPADRSRVIDLLRRIEERADRATFVQARKLRQWLSRSSTEESAGS